MIDFKEYCVKAQHTYDKPKAIEKTAPNSYCVSERSAN